MLFLLLYDVGNDDGDHDDDDNDDNDGRDDQHH